MLLQCDMCHEKKYEILKIPCGYYLEKEAGKDFVMFTMPNDEEAYRDICFDCILKS